MRPVLSRLSALLLAALLTPASLAASRAVTAAVPADPWPGSAVLTRLLVLPSGQAQGRQLQADLRLSAAQLTELRRLAASEAVMARQGAQVFGRDEAAALNVRLALFHTEKDRKVQLALGGRYPAFRAWVRQWWASQVGQARR